MPHPDARCTELPSTEDCRCPPSRLPYATGSSARSRRRPLPRSRRGRPSPPASTCSSPRRRAAARRSPPSCGDSTGSPVSRPTHTRLVYVSPLKALAYDVDRNLRAPLKGIGADLSVAIRTGDTPQRERAAMRRTPPDILITTPESLYLILTSQAREMLRGVESVIVDEIHAVASTKRGAHLALTLERLSELSDHDPQRIGLSATQNPLEEVGRFMVGPRRTARIVDAGIRKPLDLKIHVPVESMVEPDQSPGADLDFTAGGEATRKSIWPAIYPELLEQVRAHRSTIVFVNSRRGAERLALRLNELAGEEISRAHHGSLAREERTVVEEMLKAGELPCLIATSSLELGIDMGAVDLVLQVESPKSVARGLQRIGRAGHSVGDTSKGRIFPKFRADLLECAVVVKLMREGRIEPTVVPRNALDVLAQQIVAIAASAEPEAVVASTSCSRSSRARTPTPSCRATCWRTSSTCSTGAIPRASSASCARASCGIASAGRSARARARASWRSPTRARSPIAACSPSCCPTAAASASSTRRWSTRPAPGRPSCSAPRRGASRRSGATASSSRRRPASPAPCRSGRATASGARRSSAARSAPSAAGRSTSPPRCSSATTTSTRWPRATSSTTCASSRTPRAWCRATARSSSSASATRSATGGCASSRPTAGACTPPGAWRCRGASARSTASSPTRSGPTTGSSSTSPTPTSRRAPTSSSSTPTSSRTPSSPSSARARCSARASARTPRARCSSRAPTPASARRCGSSA